MRRIVRSLLVSAALGALIGVALVIFGILATDNVAGFQAIALLCALFCPPWEIFWAGIGEPHNVRLWASLSAVVVAANALLYVPVGLAHAATSHFHAWGRYSVVAAVGSCSLALGHLYFLP